MNDNYYLEKEKNYRQLVVERKECNKCKAKGITNPSFTVYDCFEINAWSQWQNSLKAKILLIGQDWGDIGYFNNQKGTDGKNFQNKESKEKNEYSNLTGYLPYSVIKNCANFTKDLIDDVLFDLDIIIVLGFEPFKAITQCFKAKNQYVSKLEIPKTMKDCWENSTFKSQPYEIKTINGKVVYLFPVYHCGGIGSANRSAADNRSKTIRPLGIDLQIEDWKKIRSFAEGKKFGWLKEEIKDNYIESQREVKSDKSCA